MRLAQTATRGSVVKAASAFALALGLAVTVAPQTASAVTYYSTYTYHKTNGVTHYHFSALNKLSYISARSANGVDWGSPSAPAGHNGATARLYTSTGSLACQATSYSNQTITPGSVWNVTSCGKTSGSFYSKGIGHDWWGQGYQNLNMEQTVTQSVRTAGPSATFGVNAAGETFGSALKAATPEDEPDLIAVQAASGSDGYVKKDQLDDTQTPDFASPEDALAWQAAHADKPITIPVFAADGVTQVGSFESTVGGGFVSK